jgi:hypothetical protein
MFFPEDNFLSPSFFLLKNRTMVTKDDLREKLSLRLAAIADELSVQLLTVYILEIFGDENNALYKVLSFSSRERFLDYLVHCDFMTSKHVLKTKALRKYLLSKRKIQYHRPQLQQARIHVLVLCSSGEGYSGTIQENVNLSRKAKPALTLDDEWLMHLQDFDRENSAATNPREPLAQENPTEDPQTPERRKQAPPRKNNASSPQPTGQNPINMMQLATPIRTGNLPPQPANQNPLDMHSTPTTTRGNGGGKRFREPYTTPRDAKTKPLGSSEKMSIEKRFLDGSLLDSLSAMKISGTSKPAQQNMVAPQQLFDASGSDGSFLDRLSALKIAGTSKPFDANGSRSSLSTSSTRSETSRSTLPSSTSLVSQASSLTSFRPSSNSIPIDWTSSVNLGSTSIANCTIETIDKDRYNLIKKKRCPPDGKELSGPIEHPSRGALYFLVTEGFYVQLHQRMPTIKHPDEVDLIYAIPKRKIIVEKKSFTMNSRREKIGSAIEVSLNAHRFGYDEESRRIMGGLIAFLLKVSSLAWEQMLPFSLQAFFKSTGINADFEQLRLLCPKRNTIENLIKDFGADTMLICIHSLERAGTYYLSFDKADASKGKMGGCVKIVSWFDETLISDEYPDGQVLTMVLDCDKTGGTSKDVADGVAYSMKKLCLSALVSGAGATTDSGGGGTIESVVRALVGLGILILLALTANCTLHNLNLEMAVPLNKVLKGKKFESDKTKTNTNNKHDDRDVEQLVFSAFAWEHTLGKDIVRQYWDAIMEHTKKLNNFLEEDDDASDGQYQEVQAFVITRDETSGELFIGMKRGCETRWWTLGEAADILYETLPI